jgi:hypothetical protein
LLRKDLRKALDQLLELAGRNRILSGPALFAEFKMATMEVSLQGSESRLGLGNPQFLRPGILTVSSSGLPAKLGILGPGEGFLARS